MRREVVAWIAILGIIVGAGTACAAEHPAEHPRGGGASAARPAAAEHPAAGGEHPAGAAAEVTREALARAIRAWVERDAAIRGGRFVVYDAVENRPLALTLVRVHEDRLSKVSDGVYFACADFRTADGTTYDLDVFMKGPDAEHLETTEVTVHKKNGVERYTWRETNGVWEKVPARAESARPAASRPASRPSSGGGEHPSGGAEHPH